MNDAFDAYVVNEGESASLQQRTLDDLPEGEVLVRVRYSSINYKDALAVTGKKGVIRAYPMVPGIDLAGTVLASESPDLAVGDEVFATGFGLGESHPGGLSQVQRVPASALIKADIDGLELADYMRIGTAGFTAMLCVEALEKGGVTPGSGPVLVTGATGGVGSVAIALLAALGYEVAALTGRPQLADGLTALGATQIVDRADLEAAGRPLQRETWAGVVDAVGGQVLATALSQVRYGGVAAACGLAGGPGLPATVLPFILRGVSLIGIDSVYSPRETREETWRRLGSLLTPEHLAAMSSEIAFSEVVTASEELLGGKRSGRMVVAVS